MAHSTDRFIVFRGNSRADELVEFGYIMNHEHCRILMVLFTPPPTPDDKAVPEPCIQHDTSRLPVSLLPKHFDAAAGPQHSDMTADQVTAPLYGLTTVWSFIYATVFEHLSNI